jgi:hypothetical protein
VEVVVASGLMMVVEGVGSVEGGVVTGVEEGETWEGVASWQWVVVGIWVEVGMWGCGRWAGEGVTGWVGEEAELPHSTG